MRRREWAAMLGVGVCAVYALFRVATQYWDFGTAASELPGAVRDYRAAGLPWTAAELDRHVPPGENAAPLLRKAIAAMPKGKGSGDIDSTDHNADVAPFARALAFVHEAVKRPKLDLGRDLDLGPNLMMPENALIKRLCRALSVRAEGRAKVGDDGGALADLEDARRLAALLGLENTVIDALVSAAGERIAMRSARACLVQAAGNAGRLARYRRWLASPPPLPDLHRALRGEIYLGLAAGRNLDRMGLGRSLNPEADFGVFVSDCSDCLQLSASFPVRHEGLPQNVRSRAYLARTLQMWTETARATHGLSDSMEDIGLQSERISERALRAKGLSARFSAQFFPVFTQFGRTNRLTLASRAVTLAFADALLLRAKTSLWPTAVATPDPLGKGTLGVRFDGKRFRVWSVGRDGVDGGGLTSREAGAAGKWSDDDVAACPPITVKVLREAPRLPPGPGMAD